MTRKEREEKIIQTKKLADEIKELLNSIVWECQEGQTEHFDKLNKSEQVALIGIFNDSSHLVESLTLYQNWFIK